MAFQLNDLVKTLRPNAGSAFSRTGERGFISEVLARSNGRVHYHVQGLTVGAVRHSGGVYPEHHLVADSRADLRAAKIAYDAGVRAIESGRRDLVLRRTMAFQALAIKHGIPIVDVRAIVMAAMQFETEEAYKNYLVSSPFEIDLSLLGTASPDTDVVVLSAAAAIAKARGWHDKTPIDGVPALAP